MRKYLLSLLVYLCAIHVLIAVDLTPTQIKLRNEIQTFLKEEGFMPEIDFYGRICFNKEGYEYFVYIDSDSENPMYVSLYRVVLSYPDEYNKDILILASEELNKYQGVKITCYEGFFIIKGEMFVVSSEAFKFAFYKIMSQIAFLEDAILEECINVSNISISDQLPSTLSNHIPFLITDIEVANAEKNGTIIQDYGKQIYEYNVQYLNLRITCTLLKIFGTYTMYIRLYKDGVMQTVERSPQGYSFSCPIRISEVSNSTYTCTLIGLWGPTPGNWKKGEYRFEFWYGDYCLGSKTFTIR